MLSCCYVTEHLAFSKWQSFISTQNFNSRMMLLSHQATNHQVMLRSYQALQSNCIEQKRKTRDMISRVYKNLKVNVLRAQLRRKFDKKIEVFGLVTD